jgi:hypothetical protein
MNSRKLDLNAQGYLSKTQRQSIFRYVGLRFGLIILIGSLIGIFSAPAKYLMGLSIITYITLAFFFLFMLFPPLRRTPNLLRDAFAGRVIEDCGVITHYYAQSSRGLVNMAFVLVDNNRVYWWDKSLSGGFESGQSGCIYFVPHSRLALTIETLEAAE